MSIEEDQDCAQELCTLVDGYAQPLRLSQLRTF
jgi:hypothetical protein